MLGRGFTRWGVSFKGAEKGFLDFLTLVDEGQCSVSAPKQKGKREVKNLECLINLDARGVGSSRVRGKRLGVSFVFCIFSGVLPLFSAVVFFFFFFVSLLYTPCMLRGAFTHF
jgi:hypothetical protein